MSTDLWKRKLKAFLHDPPDKCFAIGRHEELARSFLAEIGLAEPDGIDDDAIKQADHFASSADRFVFPGDKCSTEYTGQAGASFIHPLSSTPYLTPPHSKEQAAHLHDILKSAVKDIPTRDPHKAFFLYWRRWLENAVTSDGVNTAHLVFSPADAHIPDHSIWTHMTVTSAAAGCVEDGKLAPAFLLFQLGPVQDFIAQARSTRDLWSGSYLLSWLMAHAMKAVTDQVGPDAIIFPSLRGNGIFDALHRTEIYDTVWERMKQEKGGPERAARWLLTPTLPNRFLALVPASQAEKLARAATAAVHAELQTIGEAVWAWLSKEAESKERPNVAAWKRRWDAQIAAFPQPAWAVQPWLDRETCRREFAQLPVNQNRKDGAGKPVVTPQQCLQDTLDMGEKCDPDKTRLNNPGILWSAHYALVDAKLAARRNTRDFQAWVDPIAGAKETPGTPKDALSGREEVIGDEEFWEHLRTQHAEVFAKGGHRYGAMNLIKRLWCRDNKVPYLRDKLGLTSKEFGAGIGFDSVPDVAKENQFGGPYVAILAMDGDEMGKWVSGEKAPQLLKQLSANARKILEPILTKNGKADMRRMLSPSYHLQFSEALANFATWLAGPIVKAFHGQLIYAGGDDVLAMLPADRAIACAEALRTVFRGETPDAATDTGLTVEQAGFVKEKHTNVSLIVPGKETDVSIGLAVGHQKAPLQSLVREAQRAEKAAKRDYGRGALAVFLYKRSGETIEWGCKWDNGATRVAIQLMRSVKDLSSGEAPTLSGRFPYALAALLAPYRLNAQPEIPADKLQEIVLCEFQHVLKRQGEKLSQEKKDELLDLAKKWFRQTAGIPADFVKLFLVETFVNRNRGEN